MKVKDSAPRAAGGGAVTGSPGGGSTAQCERPLAERLLWSAVFALLAAWAVVAYVLGLRDAEPAPALRGAGLGVLLLNLVMFAALAGALWLGRGREPWPRPAVLVLLPLSMGASLALYAVTQQSGRSVIFCLVALWALLARLPVRWGVAASMATIAALGGLGELLRDGADLGLMAATAGLALGGVASRQYVLSQEAARRAEAANAVLAERAHIAREIHDILAHSLSAQLVHLEGARLLLSRDGDREQALDRVERARNLARSGLEETKRALATLRGEVPEPREVIAELAEEFALSTGRPCDVRVTGEARELPPQAGLAVVRTAQEALTNVRKHAPGARAKVTLRYLDDEVELEVTDSGATEPVVRSEGGGYGLVGMRERAELIDGTLSTGSDGPGFRVSLRVPA